MTAPAPLAGALAALFLAAAVLCTVSLWRRRGRHEGAPAAAEANHVVMGVGMAVMVLPATMDAVPPATGAVLFGVLGAAWGVRLVALRRRGRALGSAIGGDRCAAHPTHLLLSNAAMVVMYAAMIPTGGAMAGMDGMPGMTHGAPPPLALSALAAALAVYLLVHAALTVGALVRVPATVTAGGGTGAAAGPGLVGRVVDAPAVQLGCQAVTGVGMALMLLLH
ncbi:hypothetical protein GCM10023200_00940 [Actinomycetospora chlora]|uniref:DUF5134 domain-containing protein n=1 Tax=Actinomycetospora chlora TaxID=663608 RepID=A0ABP9A4H6_9PSEU